MPFPFRLKNFHLVLHKAYLLKIRYSINRIWNALPGEN